MCVAFQTQSCFQNIITFIAKAFTSEELLDGYVLLGTGMMNESQFVLPVCGNTDYLE